MADIQRLSLNQATTQYWSVQQVVEGCLRHGISSVALWRQKIAETGLTQSARLVRDAGLHVTSVCRGGMFPAPIKELRRQKVEDNLRAIDEAAELHADSLVLVVGAAPGVPLHDARCMVEEGLADIVPYASQRNVRIGLEPLHPMYAADRCVLNTIDQALRLTAPYRLTEVGVILDTFHIWWDPTVFEQIARCHGRILGFHVSDWLVPLPDILLGRGIMGDGIIDNHSLRVAVERAGYNGPIEVEIFNQQLWDTPGDEVIARVVERFISLV